MPTKTGSGDMMPGWTSPHIPVEREADTCQEATSRDKEGKGGSGRNEEKALERTQPWTPAGQEALGQRK